MIDEYRIVRRVPAGGTTTVEFLADRTGTFRFYSNLTSDSSHAEMQGELVVRPRYCHAIRGDFRRFVKSANWGHRSREKV